MKNDRLFQLLYLLIEKQSVTAPELAERLEVSVRTVYRDVASLSMAGIPVYATAGKGGGISLMEGYRFEKALLSDEEQNQLLFAVQSLQAADQNVDTLMQKLGAAFQKTGTDWISVDFSRWGMRNSDTKRFESIKNAILNHLVLSITYCSTSGISRQRNVYPLKLIYKDKSWYLQAYCLYADDYRLFKMSRIITLQNTGETFSPIEAFEPPPIEIEAPSIDKIHMKLRFSRAVAYRVFDEFNKNSILAESSGKLLVVEDFSYTSWLIGYLFSFGTDLEVLEPLQLKTQLAGYAEQILNHHKS